MTIRYYEGKLGHEHLLCTSKSKSLDFAIPQRKNLVTIKPDNADLPEVYQVINILYDYVSEWSTEEKDEIDIFVKLYDWED